MPFHPVKYLFTERYFAKANLAEILMSVELNQPVPDFTAFSASSSEESSPIRITGEDDFHLSDHKGKQLVLYFYPRDSTPGCTNEGLAFAGLFEQFAEADTVILGISRDTLKRHENFREKQAFPFQLISDPEEMLCKQFDVIKEKKLYGKLHLGIERSTFLIDIDGKLAQEWRKVKVKGHAEEVLEAARALLHSS